MINLVTPEFVCPQGHCWKVDALPADRPGDERPPCPICGDAAEPAKLRCGGVGEETPSELFPPAPSAARPARSTGPAIPGYAILGVVGHGRAGVVCKARDLTRDRLVALEVIATGLNGTSDEGSQPRIDVEVVRLRHPNIVPVFATGRHEGAQFLASELVTGRSLAEFLAGEPLPILTAAQLTETLARAVHDAHQLGVFHGDLTPASVLLTPSHPPRFVDPELGHLCDESGRELVPRVTGFGVRGRRGADRGADSPIAADVFALGSIHFELLTGHSPRDAEAQDRFAVPPSAWNPKVPKDLEAICLACLEADPARRLAGAEVLAGALRQFLDSFVTQFACSRCNKALKSTKPLRVGTTTVRCPRCGGAIPGGASRRKDLRAVARRPAREARRRPRPRRLHPRREWAVPPQPDEPRARSPPTRCPAPTGAGPRRSRGPRGYHPRSGHPPPRRPPPPPPPARTLRGCRWWRATCSWESWAGAGWAWSTRRSTRSSSGWSP